MTAVNANKVINKDLATIIKSAQSWDMVYETLYQQENSGKLFELFCKYYYLNEPSIFLEYEHVWLFDDVPEKVKIQLKLGNQDRGVDLILKDKEGCYTAVQCKFRTEQDKPLSWTKDKLANLFAEGRYADYVVVFTNASGLDRHSLSKPNIKSFTYNNLIELNENTFTKIYKNLLNKKNSAPIKTPYSHQSTAIKNVLKGFKKHSRGQLILPCGAGKTLTALWIKEKLESKRTLVLVPSLALLRQIKKEWSENLGRYTPYMCVCSENDNDIDSGIDHISEHVYNVQGVVSTESIKIKSFLEKHSEVIIYCTYQSLEKVKQAASELQYVFDLAICDEAHKTAGAKYSKFGLVHDEDQIKIKNRLYMTATPRIVADKSKKSSDAETLSLICDMSNPGIYGPEFHRMTFKEAIDQNILCDYKIFAIGISNADLKEAINKRAYVDADVSIDEIANNVALYKFMNEHNANHAITFHSTVKNAKSFSDRHKNDYESEIDTYHVNGQLSTGKRAHIMGDFKKSSKAVMTNARCLTEGVDVPAIDVVYFCDPKNSKIDVVQAAGRALRRLKNKQFGYIVVPIYHDHEKTLNDTLERSAFYNLVSVVRALSDHDERLSEEIKRIKLGLGPREKGVLRFSIDKPFELIVMQGFEADLEKNLFFQLIDAIRVPWRDFHEARDFVHSLKLKNQAGWTSYCESGQKPDDIPKTPRYIYKDKGWVSMGDWLGTGTIASFYKEYRDFTEARIFVHDLGFKSTTQWRAYCASGKKPDDIPSNPDLSYKDQGWVSYPDWIGTILPRDKKHKPFIEARAFVYSLKLKNQREWQKYSKSGKRPIDIPSNPRQTYKKEFLDFPDWLGTKTIATRYRKHKLFEEARAFAHTLGLNGHEEWKLYCKSGNKPDDIPKTPDRVYKDEGWISWGDWVGTGRVAYGKKKNRPFKQARAFARALSLKTQKDWYDYCAGGNKPDDIPSNPNVAYKDQGWVSYPDWIGTDTT